jgi:hypothetical protein
MIKTKNIKFCAYLKLKGVNPSEVVKMGNGRAEYHYSMSLSDWEKHQIEFNNSPFLDYANNLEAIKDLAY